MILGPWQFEAAAAIGWLPRARQQTRQRRQLLAKLLVHGETLLPAHDHRWYSGAASIAMTTNSAAITAPSFSAPAIESTAPKTRASARYRRGAERDTCPQPGAFAHPAPNTP